MSDSYERAIHGNSHRINIAYHGHKKLHLRKQKSTSTVSNDKIKQM